MKKNIKQLKHHPRNEEIYGCDESIEELKEKIRKSGMVTTLTINSDDVIISGNRRWKSCKQLVAEGDTRFCQLNCEIKEFESEEDELEYLIICNDTRNKTMEQKAREAEMLLEIQKIRAKKRMSLGGQGWLEQQKEGVPKSAQVDKGKTRDVVAQKLNLRSGHEVDRVVKSIRKIDELKEQGRHMDAELIKMVLNNNSPSAAAELSANIDKISEDDKQAIREKKISANKVIEKITGRAAKRRKTIIEHNNSNELKMLSVEEIVADLKDENKDRSLTQYQIALTIQSNIKQLVYAFETVRDEKLFNESMDRQSKEICVEALNQLKGLIKVLENKINI